MKLLLTIIFVIVSFPANLLTARKLRKHGWKPSSVDGKWTKQFSIGGDSWTLNYSAEGALEEIDKEVSATKWSDANKVVQDHRDGRVDHAATNRERKKRGLPTPWHPGMYATEAR